MPFSSWGSSYLAIAGAGWREVVIRVRAARSSNFGLAGPAHNPMLRPSDGTDPGRAAAPYS